MINKFCSRTEFTYNGYISIFFQLSHSLVIAHVAVEKKERKRAAHVRVSVCTQGDKDG